MKNILLVSIISFSFIISTNAIAKENNYITNLSETSNYNKDKFDKKEVFKSEKFDVTSFAFYKDQGLKEHSTTFDSFLYVIEGEAYIIIDKTIHELKSGDYLKLPANIPHSVKAKTNFKMILTKPVIEHHH